MLNGRRKFEQQREFILEYLEKSLDNGTFGCTPEWIAQFSDPDKAELRENYISSISAAIDMYIATHHEGEKIVRYGSERTIKAWRAFISTIVHKMYVCHSIETNNKGYKTHIPPICENSLLM